MKLADLRLAALAIAAAGAAATACAQDAPALFERHGCTTCHADTEQLAASAYVDIAARYRHDPKAAAKLTAVVKKGAHGDGIWPMPPLPQVPEADARKMVAHILALGK